MSQRNSVEDIAYLTNEATDLLQFLIATPSFSKEEHETANIISDFFKHRGVPHHHIKNNVWAYNQFFDATKPTILLNSHHDTVKPNPSWTLDPFEPTLKDNKLYGLGSNDAGGALCSLIATFLYFYASPHLNYNLVLAATAEEEISGREGLELILPQLPPIEFAIVGEPTDMQLAVAEKGLLVLDCIARGKAGHAAREEGENAIYRALDDTSWIRQYQFPRVSPMLGSIKMSVTIIGGGTQHNVVPDACKFTIDVRVTEQYTLEEVIEIIGKNIQSEISARSVRLRPSSIALEHPIVQAGLQMGRTAYGSPTTSDQALIDCPSLKMGPGHSGRSHTADEFIYLHEIEEGIAQYIKMLEAVIR